MCGQQWDTDTKRLIFIVRDVSGNPLASTVSYVLSDKCHDGCIGLSPQDNDEALYNGIDVRVRGFKSLEVCCLLMMAVEASHSNDFVGLDLLPREI